MATWPNPDLPCVSCGLAHEPILKIKIFNIVQNSMKLPPFLRTLGNFHFTIDPSSGVCFGLFKLCWIQNEEIFAMGLFQGETCNFQISSDLQGICVIWHLLPLT